MALNGNLDAFPLPEVLRLLARSQQTGVLVIMTNSGETRAYLEDGQLMFACDGEAETLRHGLVVGGLVREDVWTDIMDGTLLAEEGLSPDGSIPALQDRVFSVSVDAFVEALKSDNAAFEFEDGVTTGLQLSKSVDIDEVITATEDQFEHWQALSEQLPSRATKLRLFDSLPDTAGEIILSAAEWAGIAAVAEYKTRASIARNTGWSDYEASVSLAGLFESGLVEVVTSANGRPVEVFSEAGKSEKAAGADPELTDADAVMAGLVTEENGLAEWGNELDAIAPSIEIPEKSLAPLVGSDEASAAAEFTSVDDFSFELQGLGERNTLERTRPIRDEDIAAAAENVELPLSALLAEHAIEEVQVLARSYEPAVAGSEANEEAFLFREEVLSEPLGYQLANDDASNQDFETVDAPESEGKQDSEPSVDKSAIYEPEVSSLLGAEDEVDIDADVIARSHPELEPEVEPEFVLASDGELELEQVPEAYDEPQQDLGPDVESDGRLEPDVVLDSADDSEPDQVLGVDLGIGLEPEAEFEPELIVEVEAEPEPAPELEATPDVEPGLEHELILEAGSDSELGDRLVIDDDDLLDAVAVDVSDGVVETALDPSSDLSGLGASLRTWLASDTQDEPDEPDEPIEDDVEEDDSLDDNLNSVIGEMGDVSDTLSLELIEGESELLDVDPGLAPSDLDLAGLVAGLEKVEPIGEDEIAQDDSPSDDSSDREETATNSEPPTDPKPGPTRKRRSRGLLSRELSSLND